MRAALLVPLLLAGCSAPAAPTPEPPAAPRAGEGACACVGDSITEAPNNDSPFCHQLEIGSLGATWAATHGSSGDDVADIHTTYTSTVQGNPFDCLTYLGGVNDIVVDTSAATIWTQIEATVDAAITDGQHVYLMTLVPFKNYGSWTSGRQTVADTLNTSIRGKAGANVTIVDLAVDLEDASADELEADYDSGDGLHPNDLGQQAIADLILAEM